MSRGSYNHAHHYNGSRVGRAARLHSKLGKTIGLKRLEKLLRPPRAAKEPVMSETNGSTPDSMTVLGLEIQNVKRVKSVRIINPGTAPKIAGKNAQGKSSTLDAIEMALGGRKHDPDKPIHEGAKKANVTLKLQDQKGQHVLTVSRRWTETNSYLEVEDAQGKPVKSPQDFLNRLVGAGLAFDPLAFLSQKRAAQTSMLLDVLKLEEDPRELDGERKRLFTERTGVNRDIDRLTAQLEGAVDPGPDVPDEELSIAEVTAEHTALAKQQEARAATDREYAEAEANVKRWDAEVGRLKEAVTNATRELEGAKSARLRLGMEREKLPMPDFARVNAMITSIEETNAAVRMKRDYLALRAGLAGVQEQGASFTEQIGEIDDRKARALAGASFPVPGLGFEELGGEYVVTVNGIPLDQEAESVKIKVGLGIALALNPTIRVILIRNASLLDEDAQRFVEETAAAHGAQVWMEIVGEAEGAFVIEDGGLREAPARAAAPPKKVAAPVAGGSGGKKAAPAKW